MTNDEIRALRAALDEATVEALEAMHAVCDAEYVRTLMRVAVLDKSERTVPRKLEVYERMLCNNMGRTRP